MGLMDLNVPRGCQRAPVPPLIQYNSAIWKKNARENQRMLGQNKVKQGFWGAWWRTVLSLTVWNRCRRLFVSLTQFDFISVVRLSHVCDSQPSRCGGTITNTDFCAELLVQPDEILLCALSSSFTLSSFFSSGHSYLIHCFMHTHHWVILTTVVV